MRADFDFDIGVESLTAAEPVGDFSIAEELVDAEVHVDIFLGSDTRTAEEPDGSKGPLM